ncbi:MAG: HNH endonuclease [Thermoleophilaceae bacterium]
MAAKLEPTSSPGVYRRHVAGCAGDWRCGAREGCSYVVMFQAGRRGARFAREYRTAAEAREAVRRAPLEHRPTGEAPDAGRCVPPLAALRVVKRKRRSVPRALRALILEREGAACRTCGSSDRPEIDHIIPVARGGSDLDENLQVLCRVCNLAKRDRLPLGGQR